MKIKFFRKKDKRKRRTKDRLDLVEWRMYQEAMRLERERVKKGRVFYAE